MEKEKIGLVFLNQKSQKIQSEIVKILTNLKVEIKEFSLEKEPWQTIYQVGSAITHQEIHRAIIIDDFGTLPFMVLGKIPKLIVAQISDEYSAHMTSEHNGANVICLGTKINDEESLKRIIIKYVQQSFAAGRHLVRTEMLDEMLKKEGVF